MVPVSRFPAEARTMTHRQVSWLADLTLPESFPDLPVELHQACTAYSGGAATAFNRFPF